MRASRTTICIITLDRPQFVARTIEYYTENGFSGVLLIGDGSVGNNAEATRRARDEFSGRLDVRLVDVAGLAAPRALAMLAAQVDTDYAVCTGDDDFLVLEALTQCELLLDQRSDVVAAHGKAIVVYMNGPNGIPFSTRAYPLPCPESEIPSERLQRYLQDYSVAVFNLHRTAAWRQMWEISSDMEDTALGAEIAPSAMSALLGKTASIDGLYMIRQIHSRRYDMPDGGQWMLTHQFTQSAQLLVQRLAKVLLELSPGIGGKDVAEAVTWHAFMGYIVQGYYGFGAVPSLPDIAEEERKAHLDCLLFGESNLGRAFAPVLKSLVGKKANHDKRPKLLLSWGNPLLLREVIGPAVPGLAEKYWIVLFLVDYNLKPEIYDLAQSWKDRGYVADVLIAAGHGQNVESHVYMAEVVPMLRAIDFDIFFGISAMHPYERYIIDGALRSDCIRIVLWPHPTNLFKYKDITDAVLRDGRRSEIDRAVNKHRWGVERKILQELRNGHQYTLSVYRSLLRGAARIILRRIGYSRTGGSICGEVRALFDGKAAPRRTD